MRNVNIITGINYSGKGEVSRILRLLWETDFGRDSAEFHSLSTLMSYWAGLTSHQELARMNKKDRVKLREEVLRNIMKISDSKPFFLDSHFVFEDGEENDFSLLIPNLSQIVEVRIKPGVILLRKNQDGKLQNHPGRQTLTDLETVDCYQKSDQEGVRRFSSIYLSVTGSTLPMICIDNSTPSITDLENQVSLIFPKIVTNIERARFGNEGNRQLRK